MTNTEAPKSHTYPSADCSNARTIYLCGEMHALGAKRAVALPPRVMPSLDTAVWELEYATNNYRTVSVVRDLDHSEYRVTLRSCEDTAQPAQTMTLWLETRGERLAL